MRHSLAVLEGRKRVLILVCSYERHYMMLMFSSGKACINLGLLAAVEKVNCAFKKDFIVRNCGLHMTKIQ